MRSIRPIAPWIAGQAPTKPQQRIFDKNHPSEAGSLGFVLRHQRYHHVIDIRERRPCYNLIAERREKSIGVIVR
jgi:hypothetical protein